MSTDIESVIVPRSRYVKRRDNNIHNLYSTSRRSLEMYLIQECGQV